MAGAFVKGMALFLLIILVGIVIYVVLFRKNPNPNSVDFSTLINTGCTYDADCPLSYEKTAGYVAARCVPGQNSLPSASAPPAFCNPYCRIDSDCWGGNASGTTTCTYVGGPNKVCVLATSNCEPTEELVQTGNGNICLPLGDSSGSSRPCETGNGCFDLTNSGVTCVSTTSSNFAPYWNTPCYYNSDCPNGLLCSAGIGGCGIGSTNAGCPGNPLPPNAKPSVCSLPANILNTGVCEKTS